MKHKAFAIGNFLFPFKSSYSHQQKELMSLFETYILVSGWLSSCLRAVICDNKKQLDIYKWHWAYSFLPV